MKVGHATPSAPSDEVQGPPEDSDSLDAAAEALIEVARKPGRQGGLAACKKAFISFTCYRHIGAVYAIVMSSGCENFASKAREKWLARAGEKNSQNQWPSISTIPGTITPLGLAIRCFHSQPTYPQFPVGVEDGGAPLGPAPLRPLLVHLQDAHPPLAQHPQLVPSTVVHPSPGPDGGDGLVLSQPEAELRAAVGDGHREKVVHPAVAAGRPYKEPVGRRRPQLDRHLVVLLAAASAMELI